MLNFKFKKLLIALVLLVLAAPPVALVLEYYLNPPAKEYQLQYQEIIKPNDGENTDDINLGVIEDRKPLSVTYCFEVPINAKLENDLQDFMVAFSSKDIDKVFLTDITKIDTFKYQASEGCSNYAAKLDKEHFNEAYKAYKEGKL